MKQLCQKILSKTTYLWEGIASFLFAICSYQLITTKYYQGYWSKIYGISMILLGIILLALIIYHVKKSNLLLEKLFITFIIPIGMFYLIFMLPTYAPDESAHIWKAYEVSQGNLLAKQDENGAAIGVDIPEILIQAKQETLYKYSQLEQILAKETNYEDTYHVITPAQSYAFIFYIPAAIVFFIVRIFNGSIIYGIYIAKIWNFLIFIIGGYYAIKKIPFGKYILFTCLFLPMVLQQAVSLSADSIINTGLFVFIAYTIALIFQKEKIKNSQKIIYVLWTLFVSIAKMAYVPLIGIGFMLLLRKDMTKKEKIGIFGVGTFLCIMIVLMMYLYGNQLGSGSTNEYLISQNVNGMEQIKHIVQSPIHYIKVLKNTLKTNLLFYIDGCIGTPLGWLDISINQVIITSFLIILVLSILIEDNKMSFSVKQRIWNIFVMIGTTLLIITGLYIAWTGVGGEIVLGVQGRYFIPILPLLLLSFSMKHNYVKIPKINYILPIILAILNSFVINEVFHFFI